VNFTPRIIPKSSNPSRHNLFLLGIGIQEKPTELCGMEKTRLTWREAFTFNRAEQRGFLLLTVALALTVCFRVCYFRWVEPTKLEFRVPADWSIEDSIDDNKDSLSSGSVSKKGWITREGQERNYRFSRTNWFDSVPQRAHTQPYKKSRIIELNSADTIDLRGLPSIGPWLARKIVEYRERLGGFYAADQLLEVYRLTPGKLDTIWPYLAIDTTLVRKVDVNQISVEELMRHPYLSRSQARGLLAYRDKHGPFETLADLKRCLLIDEKTFEKVRDYVIVR
jgi:competence ComEA-like helix-hairpin-helix protein